MVQGGLEVTIDGAQLFEVFLFFTDVKVNVLKGPRSWSTILFMPLVQLSHFGLLPFHLSLGEEHEHQEGDEDDQHHCTHCPQESINQTLLDAELTGFPTVPVSICGQAAEMEKKSGWGEGAI